MEYFWKGSFAPLRKHVISVNFIDNDVMDGNNIPTQEQLEEANAEFIDQVEEPYGYFEVRFDGGSFNQHNHASGTYYYPATRQQYEAYEAGTLDYKQFYGF